MRLLALDTSATACSVALHCEGETIEQHQLAPRDHTRLILPLIDELLSRCQCAFADLDAIALGVGPGSFTGLRIAAGVAQGLAFGADLPVVPVSSLAAIAQGGFRAAANPVLRAVVCMDARMGEVYLGEFERIAEGLVATAPERLLKSGDVNVAPWRERSRSSLALGSGWPCVVNASESESGAIASLDRFQGFFAQIDINAIPHAADIAALGLAGLKRGEVVEPWQVEPTYLRDKVAWQRQA